ncbi:hypothetical protein [Acidiphilium multivorum]|uniref:hypothetical protein n=1 Tax=Acidiphilium multivorum TaxID=62140 RepID=UPI001B8CE3DB|nr:hypothetical protein [Acidiphilium multivorum]MBS3023294.1 hypothetical protein [Acidiphilium multivorum]
MTDKTKGGGKPPPADTVVIGSANRPAPRAGALYVTPEWIDATLRMHFEKGRNSGVYLPHPDVWTFLAARINRFVNQPPNNHQIGRLMHDVAKRQKERKTLDAAARILERDRDQFPDLEAFADFQRQWAIAISVLRFPRGAADNALDQLSRPVHPQQSIRGWAYVAREVLPDLVVFCVRGRATVRATPGNAVIKTLMDILRIIYFDEKLPSVNTVCKSVSTDIEKYKAISKSHPYDRETWESLLHP